MGTPKALIFNLPSAKTEIPTTIKSGDAHIKAELKNVDIKAKGTEGIAKNLNKDQLIVIEEIETGRISLETNKHKGNNGEMKMMSILKVKALLELVKIG